MTFTMPKFSELHLINLIAILLIGVVLVVPNNPLRIPLGLLCVLFSPGYALMAALYPRRDDLIPLERLALSFGISLAVVPLIGLMLNYLPWGIRTVPLLISLAGFIAMCSAAAWGRRHTPRAERAMRIGPVFAQIRRFSWLQLAISAAAVICLGAIGWRVYAVPWQHREAFTEFYVLGPAGKIGDYPVRVIAGQPTEVIVGLINHEHQQATYVIAVEADHRPLTTLGPITLSDGQEWEGRARFRPLGGAGRAEIQLLLFRKGVPVPYRLLRLWMTIA